MTDGCGVRVAVVAGLAVVVGVATGCGVSVAFVADRTVAVGPVVGVETPEGAAGREREDMARKNVRTINRMIEFLNHNCAPHRKVAFLFTTRRFWEKE